MNISCKVLKQKPLIYLDNLNYNFPEDNQFVGETCWMLEDEWFWNGPADSKNAADMVNLINIVNGRNANFLLNVGPDRNGNIIETSIQTLRKIGELWK